MILILTDFVVYAGKHHLEARNGSFCGARFPKSGSIRAGFPTRLPKPQKTLKPGMMIQLRAARPEDREQIVHLIDTVTSERLYLQTDRYCPTPLWERLLRECRSRESGLLLLVMESEEQIVGFARLTPDRDYPLAPFVGNIGIALLPAYRSKGIGTCVLSQLIPCAPRFGFLVLTANILSTNIRSLRLFEKFGFVPTRNRKIHLTFAGSETREITVGLELAREKKR